MNVFEINGKSYAISKVGTLLGKTTVGPADWGVEAWLPVQTTELVSDVPNHSIDFNNFPKLPFDVLLLTREFFSAVYEEHQSEAFVYVHFDRATSKYEIVVPPVQEASAGHVKFDGNIRSYCRDCNVGHVSREAEACVACGGTDMAPTYIVGTMHSHGSMDAFHSATDDANELDTTGFHITLGKLNNKFGFEIAHSFVVNRPGFNKDGKGYRFDKQTIEATDIIDLPFPSLRQQIQRWSSLVVSKPALEAAEDELPILMKTTTIVSASGDLGMYQRLTAMLQLEDPTITTAVVLKSGLPAYLEQFKPILNANTPTPGKGITTSQNTNGSALIGGSQGSSGETLSIKATAPTKRIQKSKQSQHQQIREVLELFAPSGTPSTIKRQLGTYVLSVAENGVIRVEQAIASGNHTALRLIDSSLTTAILGTDSTSHHVIYRAMINQILTKMLELLPETATPESTKFSDAVTSLMVSIGDIIDFTITKFERNFIVNAPKCNYVDVTPGECISKAMTLAHFSEPIRNPEDYALRFMSGVWLLQNALREGIKTATFAADAGGEAMYLVCDVVNDYLMQKLEVSVS